MTDDIKVALFIYCATALFAVIGAAVCAIEGLSKTNPIAYVFWPVIALNAAVLHIMNSWRNR